MSTVLFLVNHEVVIYNFRLEIIEKLLEEGHRVIISSPGGQRIEELKNLGCEHYDIELSRHGVNPFEELRLIGTYKRLIKKTRPDIVFTFTIKPNIYGSLAARKFKVPCVANITGLGTALENDGILQMLTRFMYKYAFRQAQTVFFQNKENEDFFAKYHIADGKRKLIPGSGVNLNRYTPTEYPRIEGSGRNKKLRFAFISRIMKEKGIEEYLKAAIILKRKYHGLEFHVCGFCEEGTRYFELLNRLHEKEIIVYHGMINNVAEMMASCHCIVHPTYYPEGISNVLLEACACARPIITTNRSGCREVIEDEKNGFVVKEKNYIDLIRVLEKIINSTYDSLKEMGLYARQNVEKEFDRKTVVQAYLNELNRNNKSYNS